MNRFTCLVGRTRQFPDRELVYWFERALEGEDEDNIVVRHPGTDRGDLVGRRQDFREYGDAVREGLGLNPLPGPTTLENQDRHRDRLLADMDRDWDIWGRQRNLDSAATEVDVSDVRLRLSRDSLPTPGVATRN
jgi:hypothetical protein